MGLDLRALLDDATVDGRALPERRRRQPRPVAGRDARRAGDGRPRQADARHRAALRARSGAWIEQLVAESTGKHGVGIVPVDGETLGDPGVYGDGPRLRAHLRRGADADVAGRPRTPRSTRSPRPAIRSLDLSMLGGGERLGGEFFRWEFATAVAGAVLGINPFDEPNVTESKDNTKRVLEQLPRTRARCPPRSRWPATAACASSATRRCA